VTEIQAGLATSTGVTSAFTEIKGAGWSSSTDTLEDIRDAADSGGGGDGTCVNVLPGTVLIPGRGTDASLQVYIGETIQQSLTVYQADGETPMDMSGKTLEIVFEAFAGDEDVAVIASGDITIGGADDNVVTFSYPASVTDRKGTRWFALRDAAAPKTVYVAGQVQILKAALKDS